MWGQGLQPGHSGAGCGPCSYEGTEAAIPGHGGLGLKALSFQLATSMDLAWWMQMPWSWRPRNGWQCPRSTPVSPSLTRDPGELGSCTCTGPCWWAFGGWGVGVDVHTCIPVLVDGDTCACASVCVCVCVYVCVYTFVHTRVCMCVCTLVVRLDMCLPFFLWIMRQVEESLLTPELFRGLSLSMSFPFICCSLSLSP